GLDDRLVVAADVVSRDLEGETVIFNLDTGLYFGLDPVGTTIWNRLREASSLREVLTDVLAEYDVAPDVAAADVLRLAGEFVSKGLVQLAAPIERGPQPGARSQGSSIWRAALCAATIWPASPSLSLTDSAIPKAP